MEHHGLFGMQMDFDGYMGLIEFGTDFGNQPSGRGAGLVIQAGRNEFLSCRPQLQAHFTR